MLMKFKKALALMLAVALVLGGSYLWAPSGDSAFAHSDNGEWKGKTPKYVFMFIGDGMTYPQFAAASTYLGALKQEGKRVLPENLGFMNFPYSGTATTFDSTSFCPDSASTATSLATGYKTHSGVINMDESKTQIYETISQ